jgi:hypothetical protein
MTTLFVTKASGGKTRPAEMTVVAPGQDLSVEALRKIARGLTLNGLALADTLSAFAAHERAALRLVRAASRQTSRSDLRAIYDGLEGEHQDHLDAIVGLMARAGVDPMYVSPAARMSGFVTERAAQASLLAGSVDAVTLDRAMLEAVVLASTRCAENRAALAEIAPRVPASSLRRAMETAAVQFRSAGDPFLQRASAARRTMVVDEVLEIPERD